MLVRCTLATAILLVATIAWAQPQPPGGSDSILDILFGLGASGPWPFWAAFVFAILRSVAAEVSAWVSDEKLGIAAGFVNFLAGNYRQAKNA